MLVVALLRRVLIENNSLRFKLPQLSQIHTTAGNAKQQTRVLCEMKKAYFRYMPSDNEFHVTFQLSESSIGLAKQCNFCRKVTETVDTFLQRVNVNVDKLLQKKLKKKLKKGQDAEATLAVPGACPVLLHNGSKLEDNYVCADFFSEQFTGSLHLQIFETKYDVIINSPWIESIKFSENVMAGFQIYPIKFEGFYLDKKKCIYKWLRSVEKDGKGMNHKWVSCGEGFFYKVKPQDIGHLLKLECIPRNSSQTGPAFEAVTAAAVQPGPGACPFETRHQFTKQQLDSTGFRVISYNILADCYAETEAAKSVLFPYCPQYALNMGYRKQLLLKEILGYNADLICLQEVDRKVFNYDLVPMLEQQNLQGLYGEKGGTVSEGTACFYNENKFSLLKNDKIIIGEEIDKNVVFSSIWEKIKDNKEFCGRFQCRTSAIQVVVLESKEQSSELLVVGNTHLYFHPDADHVRLMQGIAAFMYLQHHLQQLSSSCPQKNVSLILCGDFNSVPECGIYQFVTTGSVESDHIDWKSNPSEAVSGVSFSQNLQMASACGSPEYTNFTAGFKDCLDYIFYQTNRLKVEQVVPFPSVEELSLHTAIPSIVFPSDHIALVADLRWNL